jgi:hypothetical protein
MSDLEKILMRFDISEFGGKIILSEDEMDEFGRAFDDSGGIIETPQDELRYIEGMFDLPIGYLKYFYVVPKPGYEKCKCGRVPSALEIIQTAAKNRIHDKSLMRDTLLGIENVLEIASEGRTGNCIKCGRKIIIMRYRDEDYGYA